MGAAEGRGRWEKRTADLNGDKLNSSDMTRDGEQTPFLPAETGPWLLCSARHFLVNQPAVFDGDN